MNSLTIAFQHNPASSFEKERFPGDVYSMPQPMEERQFSAASAPSTDLRRAFSEAQLRLGEKMYAAGIDDDGLLEQVAALDQDIRWLVENNQPSADKRRRRESLLRRLADAALADDAPLPGAQLEFRRAWEARRRLANHRESLRVQAGRA